MTKYSTNQDKQVQNLVILPEEIVTELLENQKQILSALSQKSIPPSGLEGYITDKEAQILLGKKSTSLYNLRTNCELSFSKVGNKVYYLKADIIKLLEKNK